ncbi:TPA: aspartate ammonia-lyase, partial [Candidatus Sumerlaeota bacterium]|nr:aspartate ammonia-lyase [Candidatus Sumerlaeota bacterium]
LRVINLGGTAIGTGLGAPRAFIFSAAEHLRQLTGLGLARAENLVEASQNVDVFVEVSGILKALAVNLLKVSSDLRLMASGPDAGLGEITLPARQAGSSIMPGKINPVIPEAVTQASMMVMANDQAIAQAAGMGSLELNPFVPLIADALLSSLDLLANACSVLRRHCVAGIKPNEGRCAAHVDGATAILTALVEKIGYDAACKIGAEARRTGQTARTIVMARGLMSEEEFRQIISPESVTRLGSAPA